MIISTTEKLNEWIDKNYWFEDGFISKIQDNNGELLITVGYQTKGNYVAGEPRETIQYELKPKNITKWNYNKDNFHPTEDSCIVCIESLNDYFGLQFETPYTFQLICEELEIGEPKIIKSYTQPWTSTTEFYAKIKDEPIPKPSYWTENLEKLGLNVGFRYYCSELIDNAKVPYPDYTGYFIQKTNLIDSTKEGVFFSWVKITDKTFHISIELKDDNAIDVYNAMQKIIVDNDFVKINSGNVLFTGEEWTEFQKTGKYPIKVEKILKPTI
jgi:hypothetical protein